MEFQAKKAMRKVLLAEFNRYFSGIFHVFPHLAIPQKSMEKALHCQNLTGILMKISLNLHLTNVLITRNFEICKAWCQFFTRVQFDCEHDL